MSDDTRPAVHFVGFRDERYWSAVKVWGRPSFIHRGWDMRAFSAASSVLAGRSLGTSRRNSSQTPHLGQQSCHNPQILLIKLS